MPKAVRSLTFAVRAEPRATGWDDVGGLAGAAGED
jgi:hypothetical protein